MLSANLVMCLLFTIQNSNAIPASTLLRYEEYIIEHEISATQAKNSVLNIDLNSLMTPPGCQTCTQTEINYCLGINFIQDHCCCDKRYHEVLPYVPHTCYLGTKLCKPTVSDCSDYARLRSCCCDRNVIQYWKEKSTAYKIMCDGTLLLFMLLFSYTLHLA